MEHASLNIRPLLENDNRHELYNGLPPKWILEAACWGKDSNQFFPERDKHNKVDPEVQETCGRCAVASECLDFAIANGINDGIWGGENFNNRNNVKRRLRKKAKSTRVHPEVENGRPAEPQA